MEIQSKFGAVQIDEKQIVKFPQGLPGLERYTEYVFLQHAEHYPFYWLQSVEEKEIALVVINPFFLKTDYDFELPAQVMEELDLVVPEDMTVWAVVVLRQPLEESTVNLRAPIIVNAKLNKGKQVVLNDERYSIKHPLFSGKGGSGC